MQNLISKITLDYGSITGRELLNILEQKKENYDIQSLLDDIQKAIEILNVDCWLRLKRSMKYWNQIVNERI